MDYSDQLDRSDKKKNVPGSSDDLAGSGMGVVEETSENEAFGTGGDGVLQGGVLLSLNKFKI